MGKVIQFKSMKEVAKKERSSPVTSLVDDIYDSVTQSLLDRANDHSLIRPQKIISSPKLKFRTIKPCLSFKVKSVGLVDAHLRSLIQLGFISFKHKTKVTLKALK
ncbi:hypothetical protein KS872_004662 [Vibrio parahaemolyticus]|uniref:hypothetical protein n=1 Tax=Vibrio vulnificus TaxID=672 RepID=UPI001CCBB23F|nr:hypothetical protein [Vibrio vulnificus]EHR0574857.1 hypothetical protein [Vibrio parahaemolyticus]EME0114601.1 hypothetical protein [Vibrio parahaemolyticus]MCA0781415.1 hypothetical protein [Vibrio vulnificus]HCE2205933.1 hypothetical protein [Vibrio parahaemolyticus]